jgi:hypothetical protein
MKRKKDKMSQKSKPAQAKPEEKLPATTATNLPATAEMFTGEGGSGFENVKPADVAIPFLFVLQSMSPQVKRGTAQQIPGAEEGMLFNNVTQEVLKPPVIVVPCAFQKAYVEWVPREAGGGFVAQHLDETIMQKTTRNEKNIDVLANGNHIIPTAYHFCLVLKPDGKMEKVVISMTRTQLKKSRRWLSQMMAIQMRTPQGKLFRPPMFSHTYEIGTAVEQRDQYSWFGYTIGAPKVIESKDAYEQARLFHSEVIVGTVKVSVPVDEAAPAEVSPDGGVL